MPNSTFSPHSADALIARGLPVWLTNASLERLGTLHESQQRQQQLQQRLHDSLARITPVAAFAQPLLQQALQAQHQFNLDVRQAQLRRSVLQRFPSYIAHIPDAVRKQVYQHSLLQSALHNFTEADTLASGLVPRADVLDGDGKVCAISASAFFKLCRSLDVGGQYQRYLQAHLVPGGEADLLIAQAARTNLEAALRLSLVNGEIAEPAHGHCAPLLALCAMGAALPAWVRPMQLRVLGQKVRGAVAFEIAHQPADGERCEGVLCWIPDDPEGPLTWYASWGVLYQTLGKQFRLPGYVEFFQRFIGERDREAYTRALANALSKLAADAPVMLDGRHEPIATPLFEYLRQQQVDTLLDNAKVHAVPTAEVDAQVREKRLHFYLSFALDALGLASFALPVLALPLLGITALQVADEVYEGYADWQLGDRQAALEHLYAVAQTVIITGINVGAGAAAHRLARAAHVDELVPVHTAPGKLKLCDPALPGYSVDHRGEIGQLINTPQGDHVRTQVASYLTSLDTDTQQRRIRHPRRSTAFRPLLEDNQAGGWRHELERPQHWEGSVELFQGLGHDWAQLDPQAVAEVLRTTGLGEDQLRRLHVDHAPPPARLQDAVQRHQLHARSPGLRGEAFERQLQALQPAATEAEALLLRDFPGLSVNGAREIIGQSPEALVDTLHAQQRVPLSLAEQARWYLRDARLDRACAGLVQVAAINSDTEQLALGLIASRAPWRNVRIELRSESVRGEMRASAGAQSAGEVRTLLKTAVGYQALDAHGQALPGAQAQDSLFRALQLQLDPWQQRVLGEAGEDPEALADALAGWAREQRDRLPALLGMAPVGLGFRPPLRLGDGRLGYPLSGRAESSNAALRRGLQRLFPHDEIDVDHFADAARGLGLTPWNRYLQLCEQLQALDQALGRWRRQSTGPLQLIRRARMARRIRQAWQRRIADASGECELVLDGSRSGSLPALPETVSFDHVTRLTLRDLGLATVSERFLGRFPNVLRLDLSGNHLTAAPDTSHMAVLGLTDLSNNRIVEVTEAQARRIRANPASVRLQGNPLSPVALERLAVEALPPAEPRAMAGDPWFEDMAEQFVADCRTEWQVLQLEGGGSGFFAFLEELRGSETFARNPRDIRRQVNELLWGMYRHEIVRQTLFELATMPRRITSLDEMIVGMKLALRTAGLRGRPLERELRDLGRELFRLEQVDRYAAAHIERLRQRAEQFDENEVYLAFRTALAKPLGLFGQPEYMNLEHVQSVTSAELIEAEAAVYEAETAEVLGGFLARQQFWQDHVRSAYADRFAGMSQLDPARRSAEEQALTLSLARGNYWTWYRLQPPYGPGIRAFAHLSRALEQSLEAWHGQPGDPEYAGRKHLADLLRQLWQSHYHDNAAPLDTSIEGVLLSTLPELPAGIMFDRLRAFSLCNQQLSVIEADFLRRFPNMEDLDLSGNCLAELDGLEHLPQLRRLNLGGNQLGSLAGLQHLNLLTDLDLSGNQLGELPAAVEQLAQLSNLDLSFNRISVLDDRIAQLSNLESLHLRGNVLVSLPGSLGQLTGLRTLDLGGNRLTTVPANLNQLGRLTQLSLYDNLITLDAEGQSRLEWFSRLEVLGLGRNPLGAAPQLRFNVHLRFVSLRATGLRRVPLRLLQSYPDMIVDLRENRIATLSAEAMEWIEAHPWAADLAQNHLSEATMARIHEALMRLREEQAREDQQPEPSMKSPSRGG